MYQTDHDLLEGCLRREPRAQATLYQKYKSRFFGICRRYAQNRQDAEDIFQDAFVKVFLSIGSVQKAEQLSAWIRRVVVNVCIDYYHKKVSFTDIDDLPETPQNDWQNESIISQLSNNELLLIVNELPDGARVVFNLHVIDGFTHNEIAKMLKISEGTSKSQLFFAKRTLKAKLLQMGVMV